MESYRDNIEEYSSRGEKWLDMLGLRHLGSLATNRFRDDGTVILLSDFDEICGSHVESLFNAIEDGRLPQDKQSEVLDILRQAALGYSNQSTT